MKSKTAESIMDKHEFWMVVDDKGMPTSLSTESQSLFIHAGYAYEAICASESEMRDKAIKSLDSIMLEHGLDDYFECSILMQEFIKHYDNSDKE